MITPDSIAEEMYSELDGSPIVSVSGISYWFRVNVGKLNNSIFTNFSVPTGGAQEFSEIDGSVMNEDQKSIYKCYYNSYYCNRNANATLGAAAVNSFIKIDSDGASVQMLNKNETSKNWLQMKSQIDSDLKDAIYAYNYSRSTPNDIPGDDTQAAYSVSQESTRESEDL